MKKVITISIVLAFALIPVFTNQSFSQNDNTKAPYLCEEDWIEVMFASESKVRMRNNDLIDFSLTDALSGVDQVLNKLSWHNWYRFCDVPESTIDQWETNGERNSGIDVYNLNNIYRLQIPKGQDIWKISRELENLPGIYKAGPVPKPAPLPLPPDYQNYQGYLNPASSTPTGIDALYAWTKTGGTGTGVTVCDLEYSWNYNHADISKAAGSQINSNVADPYNDNNHGTAVIGELVADNNGWGTTGICYGAGLKTCGTYYGSPSPTWNVPGAMAVAIASLSSGDIILLEQQWEYTSGSQNFIPIEWWMNYSPNAQTNNGVYAAIVNAVTNGIHVVEAGGNGYVNTDNLTWYGNSGAIIVGAGGAYSGGSWPNGDLQKLAFSSYGSRFDLQGWGENVVTTGYGDYYNAQGTNYWYTNTFSGTSSASPIVAGAVACTQGYYLSNISATPMSPSTMRSHLKTYGTPQVTPPNGNIGPRPDLKNAIDNLQPVQNYDWGDAPDPSYPTLSSSNGAVHLIGNLFLGASIDADSDGQQSVNADGDDTDGNDDEDGVTFNGPLFPGGNVSITVIASQSGLFQGWIDFNQNGSWGDPGEQIFTDVGLNPGTNNLSFTVPVNAQFGPTYARFRVSSFQGLLFYGSVNDGEVEDYQVYIEEGGGDEFDWGDAPDQPYPTLNANNGANHYIDGVTYLGNSVDGDMDGQPTAIADGDDNDGNDDEDGVTFTSPIVPGQMATVDIVASVQGILNAWIDFDGNGSWGDPGEQIFMDFPLAAGVNIGLSFNVPPTAIPGQSFARFRFSSQPGLNFDGPAQDGEVEDYEVEITGETYKWEQLPDLTDLGMDVNAVDPLILADDFECTMTGPITRIQIWGSWYNDYFPWYEDPGAVTFTLSIHGDIPASVTGDYSIPDTVLWWRTFLPGEFTYEYYAYGLNEGWFDPPNNFYDPNGDTQCLLYIFDIDTGNFIQTGTPENPVVYWLDVQAQPEDPESWFGWKTSETHWNDDGVWGFGQEPKNDSLWNELIYPPGHELQGQSIDLAFRITGEEIQNEYDFGDAPDPNYPTLAANNGANHYIDGVTFLGNSVDSDFDGQPTTNADGDDNDGNDDEDGVTFTSSMFIGNSATMDVVASVSANLSVWIDYNQNGSWADPGEQIFADYVTVAGINSLTFNIPASATLGQTYMRFRFSNQAGLNFDGSAQDGEVEDYMVEIKEEVQDEFDWGDASDPTYPTLAVSNGANHLLDGVTFMGASVDAEPDGQQDPNALGDDNDGNDDEDGVNFVWPCVPGNPVKVIVNASVSNGYLSAWFDFNRDGDWADVGEQIFTDVPLASGNNTLNFIVPANATIGITYTRFRFSTATGLSYTGSAPDGEVEDYEVEIEDNGNNKWAQWPDPSLSGLHTHDYVDVSGAYHSLVKADDWLCNGGLVTDIHWWGNYELDGNNNEKRGAGIDHFHLSIHSNDPSNCLPQDPELWGIDVPFTALVEQNTGMTNNEGSIIYLYEYILDQPFVQDSGTYYWLDIAAISVDPNNPAIWRWQESMRSANPILCGAAEKDQPVPDIWSNIYWAATDFYTDMAFILTSTEYEYDFGDANDPSYPTLLASDGARHILDGVTYLGSTIDAEPDGLPDPNALGDDNNNTDDEDGVTFTSSLMPGQGATVDVVASVPGLLNAWIDFNGNGSWGDIGEQVFTDLSLTAGLNNLTFNVPLTATAGTSYARFRFSTASGLTYTGAAPDGEVEDYEVEIEESNIKWIQNPDPTLTGVHAHDYDNAGNYEDIIVADDWICEGGWVTDIHWWGAYDDDGSGNEIRGLGIDHFHLSIHLNDTVTCLPVDPEILGFDVPFASLTEINTGMVNGDGDIIYLYEFDLPEPFQQIEGTRYWLDITAINIDYQNPALWKWQLSSIGSPPILCGAVDKVAPNPDIWNTMYFYTELYGDMAFIITSEPAPDMDFGDANDPTYPTLLVSDGARHIIDGVTYLGNLIDAEPDGIPDVNALGDDNNNLADEDGVSILSSFYAGGSAMINVTASVNGYLNAWIDYNSDGDWNDANEQIFTDQNLSAGGNMFVISVPNNAVIGTTYARYRFSTASGLQPTGIAPDGEVEDYEVDILGDLDFGDAPDPLYPTLFASNGARHIVNPAIYLGSQIDSETDGYQDANALGDDNNNLDDEDGVVLPPVIVLAQQNVVTVTASASGYINAWIDFNMNGTWADPGEQIFTDQAVTAGVNTLVFNGPVAINYGTTFARFRFSTLQGLSFTGQAPDGEVEDYEVEIGPAYKWIQEPDLSDFGMDVNATNPNLLADDFRCTVTGPITTISIWGSWFKDHIPWHEDPNAVTFTLSIHEDIPADQSPTGYSMPGNTIWLHTFGPTEFTAEIEMAGLLENWYDPALPLFDPLGDTVCWKYIFDLQQYGEPFIQTGTPDEPVIYWLDVQAQPVDQDPECMFGWKTSQQHFNDDAVWTVGNEPYMGDWNEMVYPPEHPFAGQSVDLAFSIEGQEDPFILVDLTALLEGPYNGSTMSNNLNSAGLIPLSQPYNTDPTAKWYYNGSESVSGVPSNATDWILVELRDAVSASTATGSTRIAQRAAFVLDNGTIVATDGSSMLKFYTMFANNPYVVLWHRNHLGILSNNPMNQPSPGVYTYDFTTGAGQAYLNGQKDLGSGVYGMYGGDGSPDGLIDSGDKSVWSAEAGTTGYLQSDFNMDTQVDNNDKNDVWVPNETTGTQVPN